MVSEPCHSFVLTQAFLLVGGTREQFIRIGQEQSSKFTVHVEPLVLILFLR